MHDKVPFLIGSLAASAAPMLPDLPGPTQTEWKSAVVGLVVLAIRELVWWIRNRRG